MKLGPYEVQGEIGRGAQGRVCRAVHAPTGVERAIKLVHAPRDPELVVRFRREAELLARTAGRGVVTVHDSGLQGGTFWYAMDLMGGGSLSARVRARGGKLPWREACAIVLPLARALGRCHAAGVVHRDLKPDNILFDEAGEPCLADFGCARDLGQSRLTQTGSVLGTPIYMAPEQLTGLPPGPPADVFSLAVLLHELVTGERPYGGTSVLELLLGSSGRYHLRTREVPGVPRELDDLLARALVADPAGRTRDGAAFASELEALLGGRASAKPTKRAAPVGRRALLAVAGLALLLGAASLLAARSAWREKAGTGGSGGAAVVGTAPSPSPVAPASVPARTPDRATVDLELDRAARALGRGDYYARPTDELLPAARLVIDALAMAQSASVVVAPERRQVLLDFARGVMTRCALERRRILVPLYVELLDLDDDRSPERMCEAVTYLGTFDDIPGIAERVLRMGRELIALHEVSERIRVEAYVRTGHAVAALHGVDDGDALFAEGLRRFPDSGYLVYHRVAMLVVHDRRDRALAVSSGDLGALHGDDRGMIIDYRAAIFLERGDARGALAELERWPKDQRVHSATLRLRAQAHAALGDRDRAAEELLLAHRRALDDQSNADLALVEAMAKVLGVALPPR